MNRESPKVVPKRVNDLAIDALVRNDLHPASLSIG
jgi:hypothetical protein